MQADENYTDQEKKQANKLYGIDIAAWTEDGVKPRTLTSQLKVILENSEMTIDRVQTRVGKKNESSWRLRPIWSRGSNTQLVDNSRVLRASFGTQYLSVCIIISAIIITATIIAATTTTAIITD